MNLKKRFDIFFIKNKLIGKALEEFYELMGKTLDTDDFIGPKTNTYIKGLAEAEFRRNLKAINKEFKIIQKSIRKAVKRGKIDYEKYLTNFLISVGINLEEYALSPAERAELEDVDHEEPTPAEEPEEVEENGQSEDEQTAEEPKEESSQSTDQASEEVQEAENTAEEEPETKPEEKPNVVEGAEADKPVSPLLARVQKLNSVLNNQS